VLRALLKICCVLLVTSRAELARAGAATLNMLFDGTVCYRMGLMSETFR
jgi:hypothetical protein